jgi:uncharacterized protein (DUF927 family)
MKKTGKKSVAAAIAGAQPETAKPPRADLPAFLADRFSIDKNGLWRLPKTEREAPIWICAPFQVLAETRDAGGSDRGLWVSWQDREGGAHQIAISFTLLASDGTEVRARLAHGGLRMASSPPARAAFLEFLNACLPERFARCVPTVGWHHVRGSRIFVLPERIFGTAPELVIFQPTHRTAEETYGAAGTLAEWRDQVAALCPGNTRLLLAVCMAFAAPLMALAGEPGGGINLKGNSRSGKSTALRVAASVWGGSVDRGASGYCHQWLATGNGLESVAVLHSDTLLVLDEMGQADPKTVGTTAYMLANGDAKIRLTRDIAQRPRETWRALFLSSGEQGLADLSAEAGKRSMAGQSVRLVDLAADAGANLGLFENLHGSASSDAFARRLNEATGRLYGAAAPAFIEHLVAELTQDAEELPARLKGRVDEISKFWLKTHPDAGGQVISVARRFAFAAAAGELATEAGLTGWEAGLPADAARVCFDSWLAERGTAGATEDGQAVLQMRAFISRNPTRFEEWRSPSDGDAQETQPPHARLQVISRAGWKRWVEHAGGAMAWRYYLTPDAIHEALAGLDKRAAVKVLLERKYLLPGPGGKSSTSIRPPTVPNKIRLYEIIGTIIGAELAATNDGEDD